jgi:NADH dehydrogenase FAD-containing subunit
VLMLIIRYLLLCRYTERTFKRDGISILTSHHVEKVEAVCNLSTHTLPVILNRLVYQGKLFVKEQGEVPFGLLVWSTGLAANPLVTSIKELKKDKSARR